jgi:hypothetical protein
LFSGGKPYRTAKPNTRSVFGSARDWRGLATPQAGPERSGAPKSPVPGEAGDAPKFAGVIVRGYVGR